MAGMMQANSTTDRPQTAMQSVHAQLQQLRSNLMENNMRLQSAVDRAFGAQPTEGGGKAGIPRAVPNGHIAEIGEQFSDLEAIWAVQQKLIERLEGLV